MKLSIVLSSLIAMWLFESKALAAASYPPPRANSSTQLFSSAFVEPLPPTVVAEFRANYNQHKWRVPSLPFFHREKSIQANTYHRNENLSHIAAGFLYNSPANNKVRAEDAFDGPHGASLFEVSNNSADGLVANTYYALSPAIASTPSCQTYYVNPGFPLLPADLLVTEGAVFAGSRKLEGEGLVDEVS